MKLIAHRGNYKGRDQYRENSFGLITEAISNNFDVEIDVWYRDGWRFGHDWEDTYAVGEEDLRTFQGHAWYHAKNYDALVRLLDAGMHCFFHDADDHTLTSQQYIWTPPNKPLGIRSIVVMPEYWDTIPISPVAGVCSDDLTAFS